MGIGTSLGAYYDDEFHYHQSQWNPMYDNNVINPDLTPDLEPNDNNELQRKPEPLPVVKAAAEGPTEPAGALKTSGGSKIAGKDFDALRAPYGVMSEGEIPEGSLQGQVGSNKIQGFIDSFKNFVTAAGDAMSGKFDPNSEEGVRRATESAMFMVGAPAPVASKLADGTLGSFAGVTSKALDKSALYEAQLLKQIGKDPDDIFRKTNFFQGADGRWRYEIPDAGSKFNSNWVKEANKVEGKAFASLGDILDHPELYKAYPELKRIMIEYDPKLIGGQADTELGVISIGPRYAEDKQVLLHEVQHIIQAKEGFASGANVDMFLEPRWKQAKEAYEEGIKQGADPNHPGMKEVKELIDKAHREAFSKYQDAMGEVEARNVMTRSEMSELERKKYTPSYTEDTLKERQYDPRDLSGQK